MMYQTINGFTKQSMLDKVNKEFTVKSIHLIAGTCAYRGKDGAKCAMGLFIPDELYVPGMDTGLNKNGVGILSSVARDILAAYPELTTHMPLSTEAMGRFQAIHDNSNSTIDNTKELLIDWINKYVTDVPVVSTVVEAA